MREEERVTRGSGREREGNRGKGEGKKQRGSSVKLDLSAEGLYP